MSPAMIQLLVGSVLFAVWAYLVFDAKAPVEAFVGFISTVLAGLAGHLSAKNGTGTATPQTAPKRVLHGPESGYVNLILLIILACLGATVVMFL